MKKLTILVLLFLSINIWAETAADLGRLKGLGFKFPEQPMASPSIIAYRDGRKVKLMEQNRVTILYFWSSLTPPSLSDLPLLERLKAKLKGKEILIAAVNLNEDYPEAYKIVQEMDLTLDIYYYPEPETLAPYILRSVPAAYILNKEGQLVASIQGNAPWDHPDILRTLKELSAE
ncbi:TlpA disulfide reductase family protein [Oceanispirochaeta sp.]|uniref:TlpA disulfide reductase family protein n=1 Tax=Oceanispirochaeta sp. TaxID=2035350 RepID=UPI00261984B3|nr:TlpA disulfide reductase family protein [Oceanispirochaeta sp.]MDA3956425.1 TlpA disulfide reductase family protein [Oceanispirochaeta sp.]